MILFHHQRQVCDCVLSRFEIKAVIGPVRGLYGQLPMFTQHIHRWIGRDAMQQINFEASRIFRLKRSDHAFVQRIAGSSREIPKINFFPRIFGFYPS